MDITIYSTSRCDACDKLEQWLTRQDVSYQKKITDKNPGHMKEFMAVNDGMVGVPLTIIETDDGRTTKVAGFNREKLEAALE